MNYIKGDLVRLAQDRLFDVIVHGCNCFCTQGSGIARSIRDVFPQAYQSDLKTLSGDINKLGTISIAVIDEDLTIVNAYTQFRFGGNEVHADYQAIERAFTTINNLFAKKSIGIPLIGSGLAGGDWRIIEQIIERVCTNVNITVVEYGSDGRDI